MYAVSLVSHSNVAVTVTTIVGRHEDLLRELGLEREGAYPLKNLDPYYYAQGATIALLLSEMGSCPGQSGCRQKHVFTRLRAVISTCRQMREDRSA